MQNRQRSDFNRRNNRGGGRNSNQGQGGRSFQRTNNRSANHRSNFQNTKKKAPTTFNPEELCSGQKKNGANPECLGQASQTTQPAPITNQFVDFKLAPEINYNLQKNGYITPTPIQDQAIPQIMAGRDLIGLANTGTGKTAAFLLPLINKVLTQKNHSQKVLIISPTRELSFQIRNELMNFAEDLSLRAILTIGGVNIDHQIKQLAKPFDFVIGTPGRIIDLSNQRKLDLSTFQNIVLDEVDQMLDMGFIHDMKRIISQLAEKRQSLFFSATMNKAAEEIARSFLSSPLKINVRVEETADNVVQSIFRLNGRTKNEVLGEVLAINQCQKTLVFTRTKHGADKVVRNLSAKGYKAGAIHGNKTQNYRLKMLDLFKKDKLQILVATDVASRGLDIKNITHVINYDLPTSKEDYIHRIGRTGRADKKGQAISLVE